MQPEDVKWYIMHYKESVVRTLHLKNEIHELTSLLKRVENAKIADLISITQNWDIMPHGTDIGDPTGHAAERIADGDKPYYIQQIQMEIQNKEEELQKRSSIISYVDTWLQILNEREKYVIQGRYIDGTVWAELKDGFQEKFGVRYSQTGLIRIRNRGLEKICEIAK